MSIEYASIWSHLDVDAGYLSFRFNAPLGSSITSLIKQVYQGLKYANLFAWCLDLLILSVRQTSILNVWQL